MFGNIFKKLIPLAITAGTAYMVGGSMGAGSSSSGSLFGTSSLTEKLWELGKKEAIKKGTEAMFGGDDDFVSPYSSASVNFDKYKMDIGGSSKGGVVGFPGDIKSADPEVIAYMWKQRMNSYIAKT